MGIDLKKLSISYVKERSCHVTFPWFYVPCRTKCSLILFRQDITKRLSYFECKQSEIKMSTLLWVAQCLSDSKSKVKLSP
jgi:hypothetical protein